MKQTIFLIVAEVQYATKKPIILCSTNDYEFACELRELHQKGYKDEEVKIYGVNYYHIYKDYAKLTEIR